jgi:secondary thiamine-phosphate synthase enzyme
MAARASTGRGMSVVYDKEGIDPGQCPEHHTPHFHQRRHRPKGRLHNDAGEDNADAHMKRQIMGREVVVAVSNGRLDFGTWERIVYGEFDGRRRKRVLVKIIGE